MPSTNSNSLTLPLQASGRDNSSETPNLAPWREFFNIHALSIPDSLFDATTRLSRNITHFSVNYINLVTSITYLYLGFFVGPLPFTLLAFYLVSTITCYLIYVKSESLLLRRIFLGLLVSITVLLFVVMHAWIDLLAVSIIFTLVVCLHGVLIKVPSNEFDGLHIDAQPQPDQSSPLV
ncbi:hypothetical protein BVRB_7g168860 [Beta vulgaris subsp. vulgaris]|nr:hypothetical protein BVRB_7g168860 [Beta vulgaris subsp. vulgaris]